MSESINKIWRTVIGIIVAVAALLIVGCDFEPVAEPSVQSYSDKISFLRVAVKSPSWMLTDRAPSAFNSQTDEISALEISREPVCDYHTKGTRLLSLENFVGFGYIFTDWPENSNYFAGELFNLEKGIFVSENEFNAVPDHLFTRMMAIGPAAAFDAECSRISSIGGVSFVCQTSQIPADQCDLVVADTGPVNGTIGGSIEFRHIMSSVRLVTGNAVPQCHIDSIQITSVCLEAEYSFEEGWKGLSDPGTMTLRSDLDIGQNDAGIALHSEEDALMLIPQTLGSDSKLILYVSKGDESFVLKCSLEELSLSQGDVVTLALKFDIKSKLLIKVTDTGEVDLSTYIADGYNCLDFFIVNGGNGGAGSTKFTYTAGGTTRTSGSAGSGGYGGNCKTVRDVFMEDGINALSVVIGSGGKGGKGGNRDTAAGEAGGITSVVYNGETYSPPANNGQSCSANNPFDSADTQKYGVSGKIGSSNFNGETDQNYGAGGGGGFCKSWNSTYITNDGNYGRAGVVIICIRCGNTV